MTTVTEAAVRVGTRGQAPAHRFVGGWLLFLTVTLVGYQVLLGQLIVPLAVFAGVFAATAAWVLRRPGRPALLVAAGLALLYGLGSVRFFLANLAHPESSVSFLAEAALLLGLCVVVAGVTFGLRGPGSVPTRALHLGAGVFATLAVVISVVATLSTGSEVRQPGDVEVVAQGSAFTEGPAVRAGADAALWIDNRDPIHHTAVVEGTDLKAVLPANTGVRLALDLEPGVYRLWCDVPGHESMETRLEIR